MASPRHRVTVRLAVLAASTGAALSLQLGGGSTAQAQQPQRCRLAGERTVSLCEPIPVQSGGGLPSVSCAELFAAAADRLNHRRLQVQVRRAVQTGCTSQLWRCRSSEGQQRCLLAAAALAGNTDAVCQLAKHLPREELNRGGNQSTRFCSSGAQRSYLERWRACCVKLWCLGLLLLSTLLLQTSTG